MILKFHSSNHLYDSGDDRKWQSVTGVIHKFVNPFDADTIAVKSSKNAKSKWFGMTPDDIKQAWADENKRSTDLGSWYHKTQEDLILNEEIKTTNREIIYPKYIGDVKYAQSQRLLNNSIYTEHMLYLESAMLAGQVDRIDIENYELTIQDHKTCKSIDKESYVGWDGSKKMLAPLEHLDDSNYWHYALQLSLYANIILRYSPLLKLKDLILNHVEFEAEGTNQYGYPIYRQEPNGDYIVKSVTPYKVPYLARECKDIIANITKNNK